MAARAELAEHYTVKLKQWLPVPRRGYKDGGCASWIDGDAMHPMDRNVMKHVKRWSGPKA